MLTVNAYAAPSATDPLIPITIERRDVGPHDVLIDIAYAGICHSDIHTVRGHWSPVTYPQVVGHEIVGRVREIGSEVTRHAVGDLVGVGCQSWSCGECKECLRGEEVYCAQQVQTFAGTDVDGTITQGGYSQATVVNERFVVSVAESLPLEKVAPLLCAGVTMYSPLRHWKAGPGTRVAVVGMGGLGHVGVKLAVALGCEVTVLSQSLAKKDDGIAFGASAYYATNDPATFTALTGKFDLILNTVSSKIDLGAYVNLLDVDGTMVLLGAPTEELELPSWPLIGGRRSVAGSANGGIPITQEMLDFCAEHDVLPEVEVIAASQINEAYERVLSSEVRYRFVIDTATLA